MRRVWGVAGMVALALTACAGDAQAPDRPAAPAAAAAAPADTVPGVNGRRDWAGPLSAAGLDLTVTARDERGWRILWQLVGQPPPGPLPAGTMALGIFVGARPTGGYAVEITDVTPAAEAVVVKYVESRPAPGQVVTQQITAPYAVRLVRDTGRPVRYEGTRL